jgi:hypothetical protein
MNHNESNIVSLKLSEYVAKSDAEKVDRKGWVNYGDQNDFPQYLRDLSHESPVHGSLVVAIGDMIAGKGIQSEQYQAELDALNIDTLTYACAKDLKLFGGFFIEVIWSNDRTVISKLNAIPFEECRIAVNQDDESEIGIFHSYDWSNIRKKKNTPEFIPKYNYLTREQEPRQIYWCFTYTGSDSYPRPDYWSAINYIELDKQISIFHINQISNGLFPSTIINFYNGQATPEQKQQMMLDWENKMSGARNAGKVVMFFNERDQPKTEVTPFPVNDADKQYQLMNDTAQQKIITAHRVTTPLLFGIRENTGFGSNKDEMAIGLEIFNKQVVKPYQAMINRSIEELLGNQLPGVDFEIVPNTPLVIEQVQTAKATETVVEAASTALNTDQITSIVQTVLSAALPHLMGEKKKVDAADFDDNKVADALIALGEDQDEDWVLIDEYDVDYDTDDADNESLAAHNFGTTSTGTARPNAKSAQDETIDDVKFYTRYKYSGAIQENSREFCRKMIAADKLYRKEDIMQMGKQIVNEGWGPRGANTYSIWLWKGGGACGHVWRKMTFASAKGFGLDLTNPDIKEAMDVRVKKAGYTVRNNPKVAQEPRDMPYEGFLPDNPRFANK